MRHPVSITFAILLLTALITPPSLFAAPPKVDYLFPAGGQRGTEVAVTVGGEFSSWPIEVWTDRAGVVVKAEAEKGKLRVALDANTPPGVCWLRLYSAEGASVARPFLIEQLPEIMETELVNDAPEKPQAVEGDVIINGRLQKAGDVDGFGVKLKQGQSLVASLRANSVLGSPVDAVLQICELRRRKYSSVADAPSQVDSYVLVQNHDTLGLDPYLDFVAPKDGTYMVRVFGFVSEPNGTIGFSGGERAIYRLLLTQSGYVDRALPSADGNTWQLFGPGLPDEGVLGERAGNIAFKSSIAGQVTLPPTASVLSAQTGSPLRIEKDATPALIVGQLATPGAQQEVLFTAKKGDSWDIALQSRSLGYPLDAVLTVMDDTGKSLQQIDDTDKKADPKLTFKAPRDGEYSLRVRDLHHRGGARFIYWLDLKATGPTFSLSITDDIALAPGKTVEVPVTITRKGGHASNIAISAAGIDNTPLPPGVTAQVVTSEAKGDSAKSVKLVLSATADAAPANVPIAITGRDDANDATVVAEPAATLDFAKPPPHLWLTVLKP